MEKEAWERHPGTSLIPWAAGAVPKPSLPARLRWNPNALFIFAAPQLCQREMLCRSQSRISA